MPNSRHDQKLYMFETIKQEGFAMPSPFGGRKKVVPFTAHEHQAHLLLCLLKIALPDKVFHARVVAAIVELTDVVEPSTHHENPAAENFRPAHAHPRRFASARGESGDVDAILVDVVLLLQIVNRIKSQARG